MNNLPEIVIYSSVFMHAENTSLAFMNDNLVRLNEALNTDLKSLDRWLKALNVAKTKSMVISTKPKNFAKKHSTDYYA